MNPDCLFCKIVSRQIPAQIIFEDDQIMGFRDIQPAAPVHLLFIPKKHVESVIRVSSQEALVSLLADRAVRVADQMGLSTDGFRLVINHGPDAGQSVHHLHLHLLGGGKLSNL